MEHPDVVVTIHPVDGLWAVRCGTCGWLSFRSECPRVMGAWRVAHAAPGHPAHVVAPVTLSDAELDASYLAHAGGLAGTHE